MGQQIKPEKFTLKMSEAMEIFGSLQTFENYTVKTGEDKTAQVPFSLPPLTRVAIALNIKALRDLVTTASDTEKDMRAEHLKDDEPTTDPVQRALRNDAVRKFNDAMQQVMDSTHEVKLRRLKVSDITGEGRPTSPNVLAVLSPIVDFEEGGEDVVEAG